jgi:vacuolar-type H+-ATPase subunit I/STV1
MSSLKETAESILKSRLERKNGNAERKEQISTIVSEVQSMLGGFAADLKDMAETEGEKRKAAVSDIQSEVSGLLKDTQAKQAELAAELKAKAKNLRDDLRQKNLDRIAEMEQKMQEFKNNHAKIRDDVKNMSIDVHEKLKNFSTERAADVAAWQALLSEGKTTASEMATDATKDVTENINSVMQDLSKFAINIPFSEQPKTKKK